MQEPTLRDIFKVSWKLTKHYKGLWVLGACALVLGQLGILDVITGVVKGVVPGTASPGAQIWYIFHLIRCSTLAIHLASLLILGQGLHGYWS